MSHIDDFWHYVTHRIEEISNLSTTDYIKIIATFTEQQGRKKTSETDLLERGFSPEVLEKIKKEEKFNVKTILGVTFKKKLSNYFYENIGYVWTLYENYERGQLPYPGTISEQPNQIIEIFGLLKALVFDKQTRQTKQVERNVGLKHKDKPRTSR